MEPAKRPTRRVTGSIEDYQIVTKVGEGAFGHVFKAMHRKERSVVALKKIFSGADGSEEGVSFVTIRELKNLNLLRACASTVRLLDVLFAQGQLTMVLEFFDYDLAGLLLSRHAFTTPHVKCLLRQLLEAVAQIHALGLMHRDIKPANVLISGRGELKLADFGLMTTFGDDDENRNNKRSHSTNVVTLWYRSPELLCGRTAYGAEVDVWSVGCIMAEMLLQRTAFPGTNDATQLELIFAVCGSPAPDDLPELPALGLPPRRHPPALPKLFKDLDAPGLDLLGRLLSLNSKARISAKAALAHPYFDAPPRACSPAELPTYPPVHEYEAKRKRQELKLDTEKRTRTDAAAAAPANPPLSASASASATASAPAPTPPSAPPPPPAAAAPPRALRSSPPRPSVAPPPQPPPPAARERPDARPRDRHPSPPPAAAYRTPDRERERDGRRADAHAPHSHAPPPRPYGPWNAYPPPPLPHYFYAPPPPPPHLPPPPPPHYYDERHYAPHSAHRGREFESYAPRDDRRHDERDDGRYARPPPPPPHYGAHMAPPPPGPWPDGPDDPRWHYRDSARDRRQPYRR